jgi:hypothetical protein
MPSKCDLINCTTYSLVFPRIFFIFPGKPVHYTGVSFTSFFYVFIRLSCAYLYLGFAPLSFNLFMIHEWYYYLVT